MLGRALSWWYQFYVRTEPAQRIFLTSVKASSRLGRRQSEEDARRRQAISQLARASQHHNVCFAARPRSRRTPQPANQADFFTLPLRMQRVQTRIRRTPPPIWARTTWRLGCHRRLVLLLAWLTLFPTEVCFPQTLQCLISIYPVGFEVSS